MRSLIRAASPQFFSRNLNNAPIQSFNIPEGILPPDTGIYLHFVPYSQVGQGEAWTVGPYTFKNNPVASNPFVTEVTSGDITGALGFTPLSGVSSSVRTVTAGGNTLDSSETLAFTAGSNMQITESAGAVTIAVDGSSQLPTATIPNLAASKITSGTLADARIPSLAASKITSGTLADARISQGSVTQHQAALSITESQISDLGSYITSVRTVTAGGNTLGAGETLAFTAGSNVQITESAGAVSIASVSSLNAGRLLVGNSSNEAAVDDTVYIDTTNGRAGINTSSPDYLLDIGGDTASANNTIRMVQANNGTAIRIGAGGGSNDVNLLRVDGDTSTNKGESDSSNYGFSLRYKGSGSGANNALSFFADNSNAGSQIEALTILNDGKVGINTASPSHPLDVNGTLRSVGNATFDANVNAGGVITTGGNTEAEVKSWLHAGRQWSFSGLPFFNKTSGSTAQRLDGAFMADLNTGSAASRRAQAVFGAGFNDISGYSGAGTDYSRAIGASIKVGFFISGQNSASVIFAVGLASTSGVFADADPISNYGFGVEFRRGSGSTTEWRVFAHDGTSFSASTFTSTGITHSVDPRTIAIYSDGAGNITAYTAMYGSTSYTTATTTGGPTATSGTSTSTNMLGLRCNTNASSYVSGAHAKARAMAVNLFAE